MKWPWEFAELADEDHSESVVAVHEARRKRRRAERVVARVARARSRNHFAALFAHAFGNGHDA